MIIIQKNKKIFSVIISFLILNIFTMFSQVNAVNISSVDVSSSGDCGSLLIHDGIVLKTGYAQYVKDGVSYPAFCLDYDKQGVNDEISYSVSVEEAISDVKLWRIITNSYPYKTLEKLGCETKEEAFQATKQAVYIYLYDFDINTYSGIGEAGERTLNAIKQILRDAENSTDTPISNTVQIIKENSKFDVDEIEKQYVSKTYSIKAAAPISNYTVELQRNETELPVGIKITDLENTPKQEFSQNEKFKILIPIKSLTEDANFNIHIDTTIDSKPVLYGKAPNSTYQNYALTAASYEDASGDTKDTYYKNETKVKIIKQDQETKERLENVEFKILDYKKEVMYVNIKTNKNGEINIDNLLPGKYYLQEMNTKDGYILDEQLIEFDVSFNEEMTVTVNNLYEKTQVPEREKNSIEKTVKQTEITQEIPEKTNSELVVKKKLPVTGM